MVGVEVMGSHHYFGHHCWVMVWVTPREVARTTIGHNHATHVKNDDIYFTCAHNGRFLPVLAK
jgi:hypothetical protein